MKKKVFVLFVDLSAAFDHVERGWMFKSIKNRFKSESNIKLIQLLENLYQHTTTALTESPEDRFEITTGVRQGGPESPLHGLYYENLSGKMSIKQDKLPKDRIQHTQLS